MAISEQVLAIRVPGLSRAQAYDLEERAADVVLEQDEVPPGHMGELVTFAVLIGAAVALKGYVAHLVFQDRARRRPHERIEHKLEIKRPDGTWVTETWSYEVRPDEPPDEAVIRG